MPATLDHPTTRCGPVAAPTSVSPPSALAIAARYGGTLSLPADGYRLYGRAGLPVVVVLGGISATRHVATDPVSGERGWWSDLVGDGRAIDTLRYRVLGIEWAWRSQGPVDTADQADLLAAVLDQEGIARVAAIVGSSYGGMVALAFAERHPERVAQLVILSAAHGPHPMATAIRSVQRGILRLARSAGRPAEGVALARALGVTTYRTADEFAERFTTAGAVAEGGVRFPVEAYLDAQGARFAAVFPEDKYLALSESLDLHTVDPARITTGTTLIAVDRDTLVPPRQMRELFAWLRGPGRFIELSSRFGHDAFLKEVEAIGEILTRALGGSHVR